MKPQTFIDAAKLVESGQQPCCCYALNYLDPDADAFFNELFHPVKGVDYDVKGAPRYDAYFMEMGCYTEEEVMERRIFALCLAAAIAKQGHSQFPSEKT